MSKKEQTPRTKPNKTQKKDVYDKKRHSGFVFTCVHTSTRRGRNWRKWLEIEIWENKIMERCWLFTNWFTGALRFPSKPRWKRMNRYRLSAGRRLGMQRRAGTTAMDKVGGLLPPDTKTLMMKSQRWRQVLPARWQVNWPTERTRKSRSGHLI